MPIAIAGRAVRERGDEAAAVEEAARADHGDVDRVDDLGEQQRRRDRAGVTAAFAALHDHRVGAPRRDLLRVPPGADRRHDRDARVLQRLDLVLARREGERRDRHALAHEQRRRARRRLPRRRAGSRRTAGRCASAPRGSRPRAGRTSSSPTRGSRARRPPRSRSTSRAPATQPMPVCTIGTSMPKRSQIGVEIVTLMRLRPPALHRRVRNCVTGRASGSPPGSRIRDFLLAEPERVDHLADPAQLVVGRQAGRRHVGRHHELEAGRGDDFVDA